MGDSGKRQGHKEACHAGRIPQAQPFPVFVIIILQAAVDRVLTRNPWG